MAIAVKGFCNTGNYFAYYLPSPIAYYFMHSWLQNYQYHSDIAWWIFAVTGVGAMAITLITVSYPKYKSGTGQPGEEFEDGVRVSAASQAESNLEF